MKKYYINWFFEKKRRIIFGATFILRVLYIIIFLIMLLTVGKVGFLFFIPVACIMLPPYIFSITHYFSLWIKINDDDTLTYKIPVLKKPRTIPLSMVKKISFYINNDASLGATIGKREVGTYAVVSQDDSILFCIFNDEIFLKMLEEKYHIPVERKRL